MTPRILLLDIETFPLMAYVWGLWDNNVALNQIHSDWEMASWAAQWYGEKKMMYMDRRRGFTEKDLVLAMWKLLDESDIVISQNGKAFDNRKLNAKFVEYGLPPPSSFRHIDTLKIARKYFGFPSHKLEYMSKKLNLKYKKSSHRKFPGFSLWVECMKGNQEAWKEMEKYNKQDVLALKALWEKVRVWDDTNFSVFRDELNPFCSCGSNKLKKKGFAYSQVGKFQRYLCVKCGKQYTDKKNLLSKEKKASLKKP